MQSDCMAQEVNRSILDAEMFEDILHGLLFKIHFGPGLFIIFIEICYEFVELGDTAFLKQAHKGRFDSFTIICRNLKHGHLFFRKHSSRLMLTDVRGVNTLPLEILGHLRV